MAIDCCFPGRPLLERLRNLCITCLVFDAIFVLLDSLSALNSTSTTVKSVCYEAQGHVWHNVITLLFSVSAGVGAGGLVVHGSIACNAEAGERRQFLYVSRFSYLLIAWTFLAALAHSIASNLEPLECRDILQRGQESVEAHERDLIWAGAHAMLTIVWVATVAAAGLVARRGLANPSELALAPPRPVATPQGATPQTMGFPVHLPPGALPVGLGGSGRAVFGSVPGGPSAEVVGGAMWGGATVAQGRPVADAPERPPGPKTVD